MLQNQGKLLVNALLQIQTAIVAVFARLLEQIYLNPLPRFIFRQHRIINAVPNNSVVVHQRHFKPGLKTALYRLFFTLPPNKFRVRRQHHPLLRQRETRVVERPLLKRLFFVR